MFELFGRAADAEAEHIVPLLAKKAGEVSVAGRENFLATEAEAALATMVENLSETRVGPVGHHTFWGCMQSICCKCDDLFHVGNTCWLLLATMYIC